MVDLGLVRVLNMDTAILTYVLNMLIYYGSCEGDLFMQISCFFLLLSGKASTRLVTMASR